MEIGFFYLKSNIQPPLHCIHVKTQLFFESSTPPSGCQFVALPNVANAT